MKVLQTEIFRKWRKNLKDNIVILAIESRLDRIKISNNFGDYHRINGVKGLFELRVHIGKGYRIYYTIKSNIIVLLLCGGIKDDKNKDILKAKEIIKSLNRGD
jgi:putative addiction module killer protein